jgi:branched-chain amino acid transport system substrate-binding protein
MKKKHLCAAALAVVACGLAALAQEAVRLGLNYPKTGPYAVQGLDQWRAAEMAVEEINAAGGILGRRVEIRWRDSQSRPDVTKKNVAELIDQDGVSMVFGGSSSGVAVAASEVCQEKKTIFFGTLTYSTATTGTDAHRYTFRECYSAWMGAKAIGAYLKQSFPNKKYFYITADYTWGHTTEASVRKFTDTEDRTVHKGVLTPFPDATEADFRKAIAFAKMVKPDVLVLVLFGHDMEVGIRQATAQGLKASSQIVVPNLTLGTAPCPGAGVFPTSTTTRKGSSSLRSTLPGMVVTPAPPERLPTPSSISTKRLSNGPRASTLQRSSRRSKVTDTRC